MVQAEIAGVYAIGPEEHICALLRVEGSAKFLVVWLPAPEGAGLLGRISGWQPRRPLAVDALVDVVNELDGGAESVSVTGYHEGVFYAALNLADGRVIDMRPSDALTAAVELDIPIGVDDTVVDTAALWLNATTVKEYFDLDVEPSERTLVDDHPGATEKDKEFEELMHNLGVDEGDLWADVNDDDHGDDED